MRPYPAVLLPLLLASPLFAQQAARKVSAEDYARAEQYLAPNATPLVSTIS